MIQLTEKLWIGDSRDERYGELRVTEITAILNVASDMYRMRDYKTANHEGIQIEYVHVGLVDGPGNPTTAYCSAVLALVTLLTRNHVLVCCHSASRSLVVSLMYLHLIGWFGWNGFSTIMFDQFSGNTGLGKRREALQARVSDSLPDIHEAHHEAFLKIDWRALFKLAEKDI